MAFIIPDKILETLICDSCHKYLSVKPIKVYPNRRVKCGRCSRTKKQSDGVVSMYAVIAEKCLFKCINRFDGCRKLLTYSEVREHEKVCLGKMCICPICPGSIEIATFLLIKHFRDNHKDAILEYPGFVFNLSVSSETMQLYLFQQEDNIFFIHVTNSKLEGVIRLNVSYVGDPKTAKSIHQQYTVCSENKILNFTSTPKQCSIYGTPYCDSSVKVSDKSDTICIKFKIIFKDPHLIQLPSDMLKGTNTLIGPMIPEQAVNYNKLMFTPMVRDRTPRKVFLNPIFLQKFPKYSLSNCCTALVNSQLIIYLNCYNCQEICWRGLSHDILVQRIYHDTCSKVSICYYCFHMLKSKKLVKEELYTVINFPNDMLKYVELHCKWNCGETFNPQYNFGHEQSCQLQPLQPCPEYNCNFSGTIRDVAEHMTCHPDKEICTFSSFYITSLFDRNIYVFVNDQFIVLNVLSNQSFSIKARMAESDEEFNKSKPLVLLYDDNKNFQMSFQNSITKNEGNHWVKIIVIENKT